MANTGVRVCHSGLDQEAGVSLDSRFGGNDVYMFLLIELLSML